MNYVRVRVYRKPGDHKNLALGLGLGLGLGFTGNLETRKIRLRVRVRVRVHREPGDHKNQA